MNLAPPPWTADPDSGLQRTDLAAFGVWLRQRRAVKARFAVDRRRVHHVVQKRMRAALPDRRVQADERADAQCVIGRFFNRLVAADGRHRADVE